MKLFIDNMRTLKELQNVIKDAKREDKDDLFSSYILHRHEYTHWTFPKFVECLKKIEITYLEFAVLAHDWHIPAMDTDYLSALGV